MIDSAHTQRDQNIPESWVGLHPPLSLFLSLSLSLYMHLLTTLLHVEGALSADVES